MVSIKKYLGTATPTPADYIRFLQSLLNGIALHAVEATQTDLGTFRREVSAISAQLTEHSSAQEIDAAIDFVIRAVEGYNQIAARLAQAHLAELQAMLAMTTGTIRYLSESSKTGIDQLTLVERNLQHASSLGDVRQLRGKLNDCLSLVRAESNRLRLESRAQIQILQEGIDGAIQRARSAGFTVHRDEVEQMIASRIAEGKPFAIAVFVIDGLSQIASRYGPGIADDVYRTVTDHIKTQLNPTALHGWSGPAIAAFLESHPNLQALEARIPKIAATRLEKTIENDGRTVLLPITRSAILQKVTDADTLENVVANLDDFTAAHAGARRYS